MHLILLFSIAHNNRNQILLQGAGYGPGYGPGFVPGMGIGAGDLSGVVGKESWIENKQRFLPVPDPVKVIIKFSSIALWVLNILNLPVFNFYFFFYFLM